jgi:hypothetical protein
MWPVSVMLRSSLLLIEVPEIPKLPGETLETLATRGCSAPEHRGRDRLVRKNLGDLRPAQAPMDAQGEQRLLVRSKGRA